MEVEDKIFYIKLLQLFYLLIIIKNTQKMKNRILENWQTTALGALLGVLYLLQAQLAHPPIIWADFAVSALILVIGAFMKDGGENTPPLVILFITAMLLSESINAQPINTPCSATTLNPISGNPTNARFLRSDNCGKSFGSIPYINKSSQLVQNNSLWFDGKCIWLNGKRLCPDSVGGGGNVFSKNGLTKFGDTINLGGKLIQDFTIVQINGKAFAIADTNSFCGFLSDSNMVQLFNKKSSIELNKDNILIREENGSNFISNQHFFNDVGNYITAMTPVGNGGEIQIDTTKVVLSVSNADIYLYPDTSKSNFSILVNVKDYLSVNSANLDPFLKPQSLYTITNISGGKQLFVK